MKILFILLAALLGLYLRRDFIVFPILLLIYILIVYKRFGLRFILIILGVILITFSISWIRIDIAREKYTGIVIDSKDNYLILWSNFEKLYIYNKNNNYEIGDIISFNGYKKVYQTSPLESQFDFGTYLNNKGIYNQLIFTNSNIMFSNPLKIRMWRNAFLARFNPQAKGLVGSILFSYDSEGEIYDKMANLHLTRLVSSTGMYAYLFINLIKSLLSIKLKEKTSEWLTLLILSPYFIFVLNKFAIQRLLLVYIARHINKHYLGKNIDNVSLICGVSISFLIIDYHLAYQDTFILGSFIPIIVNFVRGSTPKVKKWKKSILSALIIYLFFIPFEIKYFHELSPLSFLEVALLNPLFSLLGILSLFALYFFPTQFLINPLSKGINNMIDWRTLISFKIYMRDMSNGGIMTYYLVLISILYFIYIGFKPILKPLLITAISFSLISFFPVENALFFTVSFINVGQGDCCLIQKGLTTIMIDTGGNIKLDIAESSLIPFLKKNQIYKIDYLITTHDDYDHAGAKDSLINNFVIGDYLYKKDSFPLITNDIRIDNYNVFDELWKDENDSSLVLGFEIKNDKYLIMGDAPIKIEKAIMEKYHDIDCDILKIGHHGSDTSSSDAFIKAVTPKEAIISVGKNNYGHPSKKVIDILGKNNVIIRRTDKEGTIKYRYFCL